MARSTLVSLHSEHIPRVLVTSPNSGTRVLNPTLSLYTFLTLRDEIGIKLQNAENTLSSPWMEFIVFFGVCVPLKYSLWFVAIA
jgi:hypothetical protein